MAWLDVGRLPDFPEGVSRGVDLDGIPIIIVRCEGQPYAVEDRCTHDGEALGGAEVENCQVICPRHGARFCLRTGEALTPPAYEALRTYRVRIEGDRVLIEQP